MGGDAGDPNGPDIEQLVEASASNPQATDAADLAELVRMALDSGATPADITSADNLGLLVLDRALRPSGARTAGEVVADTGHDWQDAEPYLRALGVPTDPAGPVTDGEAEAIRLIVAAARPVLGDEATLQLARVTGNAAARLAETLVGAFRLRVEVPRRDAGIHYADIVREYSELAQALLPVFSRTLDALLRRHILAVAATMWSTDDERSAITVQRSVGFADLVGYTERTATMSVGDLTKVLVDFDRYTADVVNRNGGSVVKTIGDEVLFSTDETGDACRIALDLLALSGTSLPEIHIGLARGEMVSVFGDLYGPDVNLAARLVAVAAPSTAVVSASVRESAPGFRFEALAPLTLKGLPEPVTAYRLVGAAEDATTPD
jgi:adenylate cyclase